MDSEPFEKLGVTFTLRVLRVLSFVFFVNHVRSEGSLRTQRKAHEGHKEIINSISKKEIFLY
jgi:hypothetical protein